MTTEDSRVAGNSVDDTSANESNKSINKTDLRKSDAVQLTKKQNKDTAKMNSIVYSIFIVG